MLYPAIWGVAKKHLEITFLFGDGSPWNTSDNYTISLSRIHFSSTISPLAELIITFVDAPPKKSEFINLCDGNLPVSE